MHLIKCANCDFVYIGLAMDMISCKHPRYKKDAKCPLPKELPKKCSCDECTCVTPAGNNSPQQKHDAVDSERKKQAVWDEYFMTMCGVVAKNCKCYSRQIGAVIVKNKAVLSTGYNGPPRGVPQCYEKLNLEQGLSQLEEPCCPRQKLGAASGTMLELCYAQHAERNAITQAARSGVSIDGAVLYLNDVIPCKDCLGAIINAGITEVVCTDITYYDAEDQGEWLINNTNLIVRTPYDKG